MALGDSGSLSDDIVGDGDPRQTEQDGVRFHHATQNGVQFKAELFISGIFHYDFWIAINYG